MKKKSLFFVCFVLAVGSFRLARSMQFFPSFNGEVSEKSSKFPDLYPQKKSLRKHIDDKIREAERNGQEVVIFLDIDKVVLDDSIGNLVWNRLCDLARKSVSVFQIDMVPLIYSLFRLDNPYPLLMADGSFRDYIASLQKKTSVRVVGFTSAKSCPCGVFRPGEQIGSLADVRIQNLAQKGLNFEESFSHLFPDSEKMYESYFLRKTNNKFKHFRYKGGVLFMNREYKEVSIGGRRMSFPVSNKGAMFEEFLRYMLKYESGRRQKDFSKPPMVVVIDDDAAALMLCLKVLQKKEFAEKKLSHALCHYTEHKKLARSKHLSTGQLVELLMGVFEVVVEELCQGQKVLPERLYEVFNNFMGDLLKKLPENEYRKAYECAVEIIETRVMFSYSGRAA